ncbi:HNH endonuclease [Gordonia phage GiKK]|nr:HNH endonuclease [Gordonia phage GiKK]
MRKCLDCNRSIEHRAKQAKRCEACAYQHRRAVDRVERKHRVKVLSCLDCGIYIGDRCRTTRRCEPCAKKRNGQGQKSGAYKRAKRTYDCSPENRKRTRGRKYISNAQRRAIKKSVAYEVTDKDWRRLVERYQHSCFYCGVQGVMTQDHVIPLSRGGVHSIGNIVPACLSCNCSKGSKLLVEYVRSTIAA